MYALFFTFGIQILGLQFIRDTMELTRDCFNKESKNPMMRNEYDNRTEN